MANFSTNGKNNDNAKGYKSYKYDVAAIFRRLDDRIFMDVVSKRVKNEYAIDNTYRKYNQFISFIQMKSGLDDIHLCEYLKESCIFASDEVQKWMEDKDDRDRYSLEIELPYYIQAYMFDQQGNKIRCNKLMIVLEKRIKEKWDCFIDNLFIRDVIPFYGEIHIEYDSQKRMEILAF